MKKTYSIAIGNKILENVNTILFDLDGTLIDTLDLHIESFQWILDRLGKEVKSEELSKLMGKTPQDIIKKYFTNMSREELLNAASQKEEYLATLIQDVYVYNGVPELLKKLRELKIKSVVISSTHRNLVKILLNKANLLDIVTDIVSGDEVRKGKPDPEPFITGMNKVNSNIENTVGIGDSIFDYHSCKAAGIRFIGVLTGKTNKRTFEQEGVDLIINSLRDIRLELK
jgi:HAD superfamily hydrolase (TIGR01549 family)